MPGHPQSLTCRHIDRARTSVGATSCTVLVHHIEVAGVGSMPCGVEHQSMHSIGTLRVQTASREIYGNRLSCSLIRPNHVVIKLSGRTAAHISVNGVARQSDLRARIG